MTDFDIFLIVVVTTIVHVNLTVDGITTEGVGIALHIDILNVIVGAPRSVEWGSVAWSGSSVSVTRTSSPGPTVVISVLSAWSTFSLWSLWFSQTTSR